ncbi:MAG: RNA-directed DNA polymerase [Bacteroidetes bacterium]|nr:MAG: RNA-directed DNA polymerase [Bacteroidota bacterium]
MFKYLKNILGVKSRKKYNFFRINRILGDWQPYSGSKCIKDTKLPKYLDLPKDVEKWGDYSGQVPLSTVIFPYWLRLSSEIAGFLVKQVNSGKLYNDIEIPREGKDPRKISSPHPLLKFFQRRILTRLLEQMEVHPAAHGFIKNRSIFTALEKHTGKRVVISLDIRDFFDTITFKRVCGLFKGYGIKEDKALLLAGLCCRNGRLPQGAPTSPMISNLICKKMDSRLTGLAEKNGFSYTRYADDLIFSGGENILKFLPIIKQIIKEEGFTPAEEKTKIRRSGSRQQVLGLNVNSKVSVPKKVRRLIRAMVHRQALSEGRNHEMLSFLYGHIAFMSNKHPEQAEKLKRQLI